MNRAFNSTRSRILSPIIVLFFFCQHSFAQNKLDSLLKFLEKNPGPVSTINDTNNIRAKCALSDLYWHQNEYSRSISYSTEAKNETEALLAKSTPLEKNALLKFKANALSNLGIANDYKGNYPEALSYFFQSLKICEDLKDKSGIANALNNIGIIYFEQEDLLKALKFYGDALKIQKELNDAEGISFSLNNIGLVYTYLDSTEKALEFYHKSLELKEKGHDARGIVSALLNIGGVYSKKNEYKKTLEYSFRALKINDRLGNRSDDARLKNNIGSCYHMLKKYKEAIEYCSKSLEVAKSIKAFDQMALAEKELSEIYTEMNDYKNAFQHFQSYTYINDTLFNAENTKGLVRSEMNFDFEKKQAIEKAEQEKKDALNTEALKQERMQRNYFITGFALMLLVTLLIFRSFRQKQKSNEIISEQKAKVEKQKDLLEEKQKEIMDSIHYAERIQRSSLPSELYIEKSLKRLKKK